MRLRDRDGLTPSKSMAIESTFPVFGFLRLVGKSQLVWRGLAITGVVLISIANLHLPGIPDGSIHAGWQLALHWAAATGAAFGRDIVFTYGPLGFLSVPLGYPATIHLHLVVAIAGKIVLAILIVWIAMRMEWWRALLLIAYSIFLLPFHAESQVMLAVFQPR